MSKSEIQVALSSVWDTSSRMSKETAKFYFESLLKKAQIKPNASLYNYYEQLSSSQKYRSIALELVCTVIENSECSNTDKVACFIKSPKTITDATFNLQHCLAQLALNLEEEEVGSLYEKAASADLKVTTDRDDDLNHSVRALKLFTLLKKQKEITPTGILSDSKLFAWIEEIGNEEALDLLRDFNPDAVMVLPPSKQSGACGPEKPASNLTMHTAATPTPSGI